MKYKGPDDLGCDAEDEVWKYIQGIWTPGQRYAPGQRAVLIARPKADHWQVVFLGYLGLSKETLSIMPVSGV